MGLLGAFPATLVLLPVWAIVRAAAAFGIGRAVVVPLFALEWSRNGSGGPG